MTSLRSTRRSSMGKRSSAIQRLAEKGLGVGGLGKVFAQESVATLLQGVFDLGFLPGAQPC